MRVGRNEPCPCGSGKKYKKCCWAKDEQQRLEEATRPPLPDDADTPDLAAPLPESEQDKVPAFPAPRLSDASPGSQAGKEWTEERTAAARPRNPHAEACDALWDEFEAADYEGRIARFLQALDEPEPVLEDLVSEMIDKIRADAWKRGEWEQVEILVRALEERRPEVYAKSRIYFLSILLDGTIASHRWAEARSLAIGLGECADDNCDIFFLAVDPLAYHGQLSTLVEMMRAAWTRLKDSPEILPHGVHEFLERAMRFEVLDYLGRAAEPRLDDPELVKRLKFFIDFDKHRQTVASYLDAVVQGRRDGTASPERAPMTQGPLTTRYRWLCAEFIGDQHRRGVPLAKADLAGLGLAKYFLRRADGRFGKANLYEPGKRPTGKSRRRAGPAASHVFLPDAASLERYLGGELDLFASRYHLVSVVLETLPAWLDFLEARGLIEPQQGEATLVRLRRIHRDVLKFFKELTSDSSLYDNLLHAWPSPVAPSKADH